SFADLAAITYAPVKLVAFVDVNPLNVFIHARIPLIAAFDFSFMAQLQASLSIDSADFALRENLLHLGVFNHNPTYTPPTTTTVGPLNFYIYLLHGEA